MDSFKAFLLLSFCLQLSEGFMWISSSVSNSSCEGKNINIVWEYTLDSSESVQTAQWRKDNGAGGTISVANFFGGSFIESSNYTGRLNRIGDAGLEIKNAKSADSGIYYFFVTRNTSITNSTNATVSVYVTPNISCMPVTEESGENSFTCKIPDECPGRNSIKAIWDDGSVGVLTCRSVSKKYNCCAKGDPVTKCYNGSLCTEIECKGTTTPTTTTVTSTSSLSTSTPSATTTTTTLSSTTTNATINNTPANSTITGSTATTTVTSTSSSSTLTSSATTTTRPSSTTTNTTNSNTSANPTTTVSNAVTKRQDGVDISVIVPAVVVPIGGLLLIGAIILVVVLCKKRHRAGKNVRENPDGIATKDEGNNVEEWKQPLGHGMAANKLDAVYTTPDGFIIYPGPAAMSTARPLKEKKHHDVAHKYSRPYTGTYVYQATHVPSTYTSARPYTHKDRKHDITDQYSRPDTGTYGYQATYVPSNFTSAKAYTHKGRNHDYVEPIHQQASHRMAARRPAYNQTPYYPQTGYYGQIGEDVYYRGGGQYMYGQKTRSHHDHGCRQQQQEYYNQYEMANYGGSRAGYGQTKQYGQDTAFYY